MTKTEETKAVKKHIPLIKFLLIWFAGLVFTTGCAFLLLTFAYLVGGAGTPDLEIPIVAIVYSLPATIVGLLLYLFYWLILGKKQKAKWLEAAAAVASYKEKARLYDEYVEKKEKKIKNQRNND